MPEHLKETPATAEGVGALRRWIEGLCDDAGASGAQRADVALAVSEALTNVVLHAYEGRAEPGPMRVRAQRSDHRLVVEIEDEGIGIRPRVDSPGGGFGLALIASVAAELRVARGPAGEGSRLEMAFRLS